MPATLTSLRIRNLALVEELTWTLAAGFTVVTGETGSGKSIIVGALKLILGERADKTLVRTGAESCTVEAVFQFSDTQELNKELEEFGVEPCEAGELILKRVFSTAGTNTPNAGRKRSPRWVSMISRYLPGTPAATANHPANAARRRISAW